MKKKKREWGEVQLEYNFICMYNTVYNVSEEVQLNGPFNTKPPALPNHRHLFFREGHIQKEY